MQQSGVKMRKHQRVLVPAERKIRAAADGDGLQMEGLVTVIGLGGIFVRTKSATPCGAKLHLKMTDSVLSLESDCIVRHVADQGIGVEFSGLTPENERKLTELLRHLKGEPVR